MTTQEPDVTTVGIFVVVTALAIGQLASGGWVLHFTWWLVPALAIWLGLALLTGLWVWARLKGDGRGDA